MINKVTLVGRLGRAPEMHYTPQGTTVTTFPLATERSWKDESGADHKETTWHSIVTRDKLAEICNTQLTKGQMVYLEGRLKTEKYDDKSGDTRYFTKIVALGLQFLDKKDKDEPVMTVEEDAADYEL